MLKVMNYRRYKKAMENDGAALYIVPTLICINCKSN